MADVTTKVSDRRIFMAMRTARLEIEDTRILLGASVQFLVHPVHIRLPLCIGQILLQPVHIVKAHPSRLRDIIHLKHRIIFNGEAAAFALFGSPRVEECE